MTSNSYVFQVSCASHRPPISYKSYLRPKAASPSSLVKPRLRDLPQIPTLLSDVPKIIKSASTKVLDAFVDNVFEFVDQPYLPSQSNFAPVDEIGEAVQMTTIEGSIPDDFPEGVYLRNGANPGYGGLKSAKSIFGKSSHIWVEGQGMIHAFYFNKDNNNGTWNTFYNNKYVQTETSQLEKQRNKPVFLPSVEGNPPAVLASMFLNWLRFGKFNESMSNTSVFEHAGKYYSISEIDMPQEIDIHTLQTLHYWDTVLHSWKRNFTSHPKKAPETGELITFGADAQKPYLVLGVISADGTKILHEVDLKFERSIICHDIGVTQYNVIMDFPIVIDPTRLFSGGSLIKYEKENYARIGVMPRYGDANSVHWFEMESCCPFHIINSYEEGDEVVVMACRAEDSIIPGPDLGIDKFDWFSKGFKHINSIDQNSKEGYLFSRPFMWRLNMQTGKVKQNYLIGTEFSMDFPMINDKFTGLKNKYAFTQVVDSDASSAAAMPKYGGLAKIYLEDKNLNFSEEGEKDEEEYRKVDYHMFPENTFCTGSAFIAKDDAVEEDDGWLITAVHNETTNISQVYIVDAKNFSSEPVAKITLPCRVPYGFHGAFMPFGST